jgi:hypothetical protein
VFETFVKGDTVLTVHFVSGDQIKYLRVPDALLDVVKEDQSRAREAGKNARGGSHSGGLGRGESYACTILVLALISLPSSQVAVEHHSEVWLYPAFLLFLVTC